MKHKWILLLLTVVLALSLVTAGCEEKQEKHAIFTFGQWSGDWLTIYVPKILLEEEFGYTTEIAELSIPAGFAAIGAGEADLWTDSWQPNQKHLWDKYDATIDPLGVIYTDCFQGWLVPKWMSEQYGITTSADLNDPEIAKMFDVDSDGIGDLLGCDAAWTCGVRNDELLVEKGLDTLYKQVYAAEVMMDIAIEGYLKKHEPVLFYLYKPHPFFVKFPVGESVVWMKDAEEDWGMVEVYKFGNVDWIAANPQAAELLRQVEMLPEDIEWIMAQIDEKGDATTVLEALVREWMAEHQTEIDSWLKAAKAAK